MLVKLLTLFLERRNYNCTITAHSFDVAVWLGSYHALLTGFELRGEPNWCCGQEGLLHYGTIAAKMISDETWCIFFRITLHRNNRDFMRMFF